MRMHDFTHRVITLEGRARLVLPLFTLVQKVVQKTPAVSKITPIPSFTISYISPLIEFTEGDNENEWVNSDTECTGRTAAFV